MSAQRLVDEVLAATPTDVPAGARRIGLAGLLLAALAIVLAFALGGMAAGWSYDIRNQPISPKITAKGNTLGIRLSIPSNRERN